MHKVTVTPSVAIVLLKLATRCFTKVGNGRKIRNDRAAGVEPPLQSLQSSGRLLLLLELNINITDHVIGQVITNIETLDLAELAELFKDILVEVLKVFLNLPGINRLALSVYTWSNHVGTLIHVGEEKRWGDRGAIVEARASISVTTSTDLEIERTVHAVLFGAEDGSQVLRH